MTRERKTSLCVPYIRLSGMHATIWIVERTTMQTNDNREASDDAAPKSAASPLFNLDAAYRIDEIVFSIGYSILLLQRWAYSELLLLNKAQH